MDSEIIHLNEDIISEILSRTTLKTLDTCKVVSKELNELIGDSEFLKNYTRRTKNIVGYFVQTFERNIVRSMFVSIDPTLRTPSISIGCLGNDVRIVASSPQGILCCLNYKHRLYKYCVCKPSTRQYVVLPSPRGEDPVQRIVLMVLKSNPFHYKIIKFSHARRSPPGKNSYLCEILDSKIWTWRQLKNIITEENTIFRYQPSICIGGIAYWLTNQNSILTFDTAPIAAFEDKKDYQNERIVEYKSDKMLLWVVEDRRNYKWEIKNMLIGCRHEIFPFRSDWEPVKLMQIKGTTEDN